MAGLVAGAVTVLLFTGESVVLKLRAAGDDAVVAGVPADCGLVPDTVVTALVEHAEAELVAHTVFERYQGLECRWRSTSLSGQESTNPTLWLHVEVFHRGNALDSEETAQRSFHREGGTGGGILSPMQLALFPTDSAARSEPRPDLGDVGVSYQGLHWDGTEWDQVLSTTAARQDNVVVRAALRHWIPSGEEADPELMGRTADVVAEALDRLR
ncbi:hypothetical protein Nans01_40850 [Nocardiopsis ansamitocini]|uniref:Uncharacterized protein n=2 Tax=Nocardiopsis ansamitocini TaxID=1670832 RepID=A0A9W6P9Y1_9ACTN|nr:hypothetical protein Nans01_40850 [Nocardiopsis ansamitocini]